MSEVKSYRCVSCGKELKKVLPLHHEASKTWLRKHGYDSAEWDDFWDNVKPLNFPHLDMYGYRYVAMPNTNKQHERVRFSLCLNCTSRDFKFTGEKEEREVDA